MNANDGAESKAEIESAIADRQRRGDYPAADIPYCICGTIWNVEAMQDLGYASDVCQDCGHDPFVIERALKQ